MYKEFMIKAWKFRQEIRQHQEWMEKYAAKRGYTLNPHKMYRTNLIIWLEENKRLYHRQVCPCFEASGEAELDKQLVCPCTFCETDVETKGSCHCGLFGRAEYTEEDFRDAEAKVMKSYRIPLKWQGDLLDTTGQPKDALRGLPVPDAMHQFKQARNQRAALDFEILCEEEQSAQNIKAYVLQEGIRADIRKLAEGWLLRLNPEGER
ncbi:MAG: ferredoxin-thioredoxin reductase catalytic domain-containing protein [Desulfitobacteriaceae bacterium]|nr:ferredoxin-thioredoxin reductase catalytic domain-containing protein [Desulfitobacteriaceae bacterium]MDI6879245.1 ferredoxin-thioredoxin reductase catalytic domain-containing protein [Desulfitobacteriaceae bacterium]MDI6913725.1 ferredoxin-thioredoxin reductase catalytic domain-containing protein [Desulfitobacteriaceae bacterium]